MYKYTNTTLSRPLDLKAVIRLHIGQYLLHQELVGATGVMGAVGAMGVVGATGATGAVGATGAAGGTA